jgi:regulator of RNase E activity RraA
MDYFRHMAGAAAPSIAVVEDVDGANATGAWWGEVHARVHAAFGLVGAVTNGLVRDLGEMRTDFPILGGAVGPSHGFVHVHDFGMGARVFGLDVVEGRLIHADRHGAVAIPASVLDGLPDALQSLRQTEDIVLSQARAGMTFETFEAAWARFEDSQT